MGRLKSQIFAKLRLAQNVPRAMALLPSKQPAVVVASFGRAGSTVVWKAAHSAMCRARLGKYAPHFPQACARYSFNMPAGTKLQSGLVHKTHDYPDLVSHSPKARTIFLFGSATDAALSVHEQKTLRDENWVRLHFKHLHRPYRYDDLLDEDVLGIQEQCIQWMGHTASPVLCVRFEALWDCIDKVSAFCNLDIQLPERRPRKEKEVNSDELARAQATYGPLDAAIANLPDCFEAAPEYAARMRGI